MKLLISKLLFVTLVAILMVSCNEEYIDDISSKPPPQDLTAPTVTVNFPREGTEIKVLEELTNITIDFEVEDDVEIATISVMVNGSSVVTMDEFLDFRIVKDTVPYEGLGDGEHTVTVTATDIEGKTTSETVNFKKTPPYITKYRGEILYMPFDDSYLDLVGFREPTVVGMPGFAGEGAIGGDAYAGAENTYLTIPAEGLVGSEFSATFWMKVNDDPDRAGIIVVSPPDPDNPSSPNNRTTGFRFFRENAGGEQRFKLNVGRGDGDSWFDGGEDADVIPNTDEWTHFAFTISQSRAAVYINGQVVREGEFGGVDFANTDVISIMSGEPNWTGWSHFSDLSFLDELRFYNVALTQQEIQTILTDDGGDVASDEDAEFGEILYMPFDGDFTDVLSGESPDVIGDPGFAGEGKDGSDAYKGALDSYLSFPSDRFENEEISATFWMKVDSTLNQADQPRAGILVINPPSPDDGAPTRTSGFRFFREKQGPEGYQQFKLNVGRGDGDNWFDGGEAARVEPNTGEWVFFAYTISADRAAVYINGEVVREGELPAPISWADCETLSIMSGAPRFINWGHFSDLSVLDELRIFDRSLTPEEINSIMNSDN
ncbi:MAG TPA: LamG-like jellyroll fold domain-containing protein [Cyclobacteriaceae bacterium]